MHKKILSLFLSLAMIFALSIPAFASEPAAQAFLEMDRETTDLATYQAAMAAYVESQRDEIAAEIAAYKASIPSTRAYTYGGFTYLLGDIIVTSDTSASGILGHAGIVIESSPSGCKILEITPNPYNGANKHPVAVTISQWFSEYNDSYVLRYTSITNATNAGNYGKSYFVNGAGSSMVYNIANLNLYGTGDTYCSALVWRCFYNGAGIAFEIYTDNPSGGKWQVGATFLPYDFITFRAHNGLTAVHSVNW